jgi:hypothetical protein
MRTFILRRGGVEFYCEQDSYGKRKEFLSQLFEDNMLEMKLDSIVDYFLCDGQGLFYFRPTGDTYQILYFAKISTDHTEINRMSLIVLHYLQLQCARYRSLWILTLQPRITWS